MTDSRKSVLITGCSGPGIGRHLAQVFHERNYRVFATARKSESLADLAAQGIETLDLVVDEPASVRACYAEVEHRLAGKGLDILFNNAGRNCAFATLDVPLSEVRATFETNLFAIIDINATFAPLLIRARGTIAHTGSAAAVAPVVFSSAYNASKAALHSYCATLRVELAPLGVHVVTVVAGTVRSNIIRTRQELPEGSVFAPWSDALRRGQEWVDEMGIDTRVFAERVVAAVVGSRGTWWNTNEVWTGNGALGVWVLQGLDSWVSGRLSGFVMPRVMGYGRRVGGTGKERTE